MKNPASTNIFVVMELGEVWHYLKSKRMGFGFGRLFVALLVSFLTGVVGVEVAKHFSGCWIGFTDGM